jgi:hypothetical protein
LEPASRQIALSGECEMAFPANKRLDNSQSGMISENDRITYQAGGKAFTSVGLHRATLSVLDAQTLDLNSENLL